MPGINIRFIDTLTAQHQQELLELFAEADFIDNADAAAPVEWLEKAVDGSLLAVGAFDESGKLRGFARALGDGTSDCYIQDVVVHPEFRNQGIGKVLVEKLLGGISERKIDWVGLIATPGKEGFYRKLGFEVMDGFVPMMLKKSE